MTATDGTPIDQDRRMQDAVTREWPRLRAFVRRRVADLRDAEDVLQDVFAEAVEAYRGTHPVELATAWFYRVARNRIVDLVRRRRPSSLQEPVGADQDEAPVLEDLLASNDVGPEAALAHRRLVDALERAIDALPADQRFVFIAHEIEGRSFKDLSRDTGVSVNTLLSRKHYAVRRLRQSLRDFDDAF